MAGAALLAALPAGTSASELLSGRVASGGATFRECSRDPVPDGRGFVQRSVTSPRLGWVTARLAARGGGDWDLAIFDRSSGALVAGSAGFGGSEVASGIARAGQRLVVQACRLSGPARTATLAVEHDGVDLSPRPEQVSLVRVSVPTPERKRQLAGLGLDLTEEAGENFVEVVLHGEEDAKRLRDNKFVYTTQVADLAAQDRRNRATDRRFAGRVRASAFPSERTTYRRLSDYGEDMKRLVRDNPNLVKPIVLPFKTWTGMSVEGIEITTDVHARDGKPVFLQMGAHHAREWPSSEHAMEWAFELVNGYRAGNERVRNLVENTRTIVIPIVNPEGFNTSREAAAASDDGRGGPNETVNLAIPYEYQRKNCRVTPPDADDPQEGDCSQQPATGLQQFGVDPNRNYGGFWGGPGASAPGGTPPGDYAQNYRGNGPFSEPETRNIRRLVAGRHVVTLITNHTFSNLLLRPPALQAAGPTFDEELYRTLGREMAVENGYTNQPSYRLYDTSGGTEDWTYYATGGLGFTFEIGPTNFHPPYEQTVAEYEGNTEAANRNGDGKGNREAYFKAMESTANASRHSLLAGRAPGGSVLRLKKRFKTSTSPVIDSSGEPGTPILFDDTLDTTTVVPGSSTLAWHINPSTRPIVAQTTGRDSTGSPSPPVDTGTQVAPVPPCPTYFEVPGSCPPTSYRDHEFTVPPNGGGVDNGFATIRLEWTAPSSDYDLEIYRDANSDGDLDDQNEDNEPESAPVASSATGSGTFEQTTIGPDPAPGRYLARVINFAGADPYTVNVTFKGPEPFKAGGTETWRLTCESFSGTVLTEQDLLIKRGERKDPGLEPCIAAFERAFATGRGCDRPTRKVYRKGLDRARLGRGRTRHLRAYAIGLKGRRGLDKFCLRDKSSVRIGYPQRKVLRKLNRKQRRGLSRTKAGLILTSSKKFRMRKVRVGTRLSTLRKRAVGRRRGIKVGKNTWYLKRGGKSRLVFKVRRGRVRELGQASMKLTSNRKRSARLLRSFRLR